MNTSRGIIYVATGDNFYQEAEISAKAVKEEMEVSITLFTDRDRNTNTFDNIEIIPNPTYGFIDKIYGIKHSPYNKTIYLDTDTLVCDEIYELFDILGEFDLAATFDVTRWAGNITDNATKPGRYVDEIPRSFPTYSTGLIAFIDNDRTNSLFNNWQEVIKSPDHGDQPSFRRALYYSDVRINALIPAYNYVAKYPGHAYGKVKVIHHRLIDIDSPGASKSIDIEQFHEKINRNLGHRVSFMDGSDIHVVHHRNPDPGIIRRTYDSIEHSGIEQTLAKGVQMVLKNAVRYAPSSLKRLFQHTLVHKTWLMYSGGIKDLTETKIELPDNSEETFYIPQDVTKHINNGMYEPLLTQDIYSELTNDSVFYDVGSYFGYFSRLAQCYGLPDNNIYTFEANYSRHLLLSKIHQGDNINLTNNFVGNNPEAGHTVLDHFVLQNQSPDIVKIDVEGHEYNVLRGMKKLLQNNNVILYIEMHPAKYDNNQEEEEITDFLHNLGYSLILGDHKSQSNWKEVSATEFPTFSPSDDIRDIPENTYLIKAIKKYSLNGTV
jgi:hypothetical protein